MSFIVIPGKAPLFALILLNLIVIIIIIIVDITCSIVDVLSASDSFLYLYAELQVCLLFCMDVKLCHIEGRTSAEGVREQGA